MAVRLIDDLLHADDSPSPGALAGAVSAPKRSRSGATGPVRPLDAPGGPCGAIRTWKAGPSSSAVPVLYSFSSGATVCR